MRVNRRSVTRFDPSIEHSHGIVLEKQRVMRRRCHKRVEMLGPRM